MNLHDDWNEIRHIFARSVYASMATVDADGHPHVSPIGSLVLHREPGRGFWFERFTTALPRHLDTDPRLCAMAVDTRVTLWGRALVAGRFPQAPGIRLRGTAGDRRPGTERELDLFKQRVRATRWTRGHKLLWEGLAHGRDVVFDEAIPLRIGALWPPRPAALAA
ncbi:MAG: pyridoxamine 5'-phosphate oxidase family protein [Acidobacteriota bacterium]